MHDKTKIIILAILVVTLLEIIALFKGIDGAVFMSALSIIGGLAGYHIKGLNDNNKK